MMSVCLSVCSYGALQQASLAVNLRKIVLLILWLVHTGDADKTKLVLSCRVGDVNTIGDATVTHLQLLDDIVIFAFAQSRKPVGLKNIGNTCYFNSVIQVPHSHSWQKVILCELISEKFLEHGRECRFPRMI